MMDDIAMAPLSDVAWSDLLEVFDDRHGARFTIVTSKVPVKHWHAATREPMRRRGLLPPRRPRFVEGGASAQGARAV